MNGNDDTFRAEYFIQQSFRDGILSNGTQKLTNNTRQVNCRTSGSRNTTGLQIQSPDIAYSHQEQLSTLTEVADTKGNIIHANEYLSK